MTAGAPIAVGHRAAAQLGRGAEARVLAPTSATIYVVVRDEILWLGGPRDPLHPRAILLAAPPLGLHAAGDVLRVPGSGAPVWRPAPLCASAAAVAALRAGAAALAAEVAALGRPAGFGARLLGAPLPFPLQAAGPAADALAAACGADDPARAAEAARALLGLGAGLTPSGDDFVGGAFFARAILARAGAGDGARWRAAAHMVREAAGRATHPISAAMLDDLLRGESWAPLHALGRALVSGRAPASFIAARRLTALGHSSGWDLLAGFLAGIVR